MEFLRQRYAEMDDELRPLAAKVLEQESAIVEKLSAIFKNRISSERSRFHGRLHLGHLLVTANDDVSIFDFEGDPDVSVSERRIKRCPLRDASSMLASFGYAARAAIVRRFAGREPGDRAFFRRLRDGSRVWYSHVSAAFIRGYWQRAKGARYMPESLEDQQTLLQTYLMERALLDLRTDIQSKPELSAMPLRIILHLLDAEAERRMGREGE